MRFLKCTLAALLVLSLFELTGCGPEKEKPKSDIKAEQYTMIIVPSPGQIVKSGDDLTIEVSFAEIPDGYEKLVLKMDNEEIFSTDEMENPVHFSFNTTSLIMGFHVLSSELYTKDSDPEINTVTFMVTSDLVPEKYTYMIRNKYRHDINAYTQGLEFHSGQLYEGTGLNGKSELREVDLRTGNVLKSAKLDQEFFGEGITVIDDQIFQITYQSHKGFVYDRKTLKKTAEFTYTTEGWGLTHDDQHLIMSDGTNKLYFLDKNTYERKKTIEVYDNVGPVNMLNELEYVDGEIWANVYLTQEIMRIDPKTGKVTGIINCSGIFDPSTVNHKTDVLNGIAYEPATKKIYLTGKLWPNVFEVEILNAE